MNGDLNLQVESGGTAGLNNLLNGAGRRLLLCSQVIFSGSTPAGKMVYLSGMPDYRHKCSRTLALIAGQWLADRRALVAPTR
jgi:hypothetical protein